MENLLTNFFFLPVSSWKMLQWTLLLLGVKRFTWKICSEISLNSCWSVEKCSSRKLLLLGCISSMYNNLLRNSFFLYHTGLLLENVPILEAFAGVILYKWKIWSEIPFPACLPENVNLIRNSFFLVFVAAPLLPLWPLCVDDDEKAIPRRLKRKRGKKLSLFPSSLRWALLKMDSKVASIQQTLLLLPFFQPWNHNI
jgi:hypothetical protein